MIEIICAKILKQDHEQYRIYLASGLVITGRLIKMTSEDSEDDTAVLVQGQDELRTWVSVGRIEALAVIR